MGVFEREIDLGDEYAPAPVSASSAGPRDQNALTGCGSIPCCKPLDNTLNRQSLTNVMAIK